jgi:hypothetical protein
MNAYQYMERVCETCPTLLTRRPTESASDFRKRRFCVPCRSRRRSENRKQQKRGFFTSPQAKEFRKQQLAVEEKQAEKLRQAGWEIFSPTVVCDRIGVKDGRVFFIEFKKVGREKLRAGQQRIADLVPNQYVVRVHD